MDWRSPCLLMRWTHTCGRTRTAGCGSRRLSSTVQSGKLQSRGLLKMTEDKKDKSPLLAAVLSGLITGLGQFYNGEWAKGAGLILLAIGCAFTFFPLVVIVWVYGIYDAYTICKRNNPEA